ncbi:14370_t:CDS:2, partial [Gigaspora rosea]
ESLPKQLEYDSRLVINRLGEFYLCIPEPLKIQAENQGPLFSENQEKRVMLHIHKRICCLVHECHHKLTKWLCENYRIIILPEFRTQRMVRRGQRRIGSKTAEPCVREEYTSKTCGFCGYIHHKLGGSKVFRCPK